ncbi:MAG: glutamine--fructose-6-phosphate transaminase (isomerizing) [Candidatus Eisenbacteria bacterium]|uniref:Glutamine--fructose-6-phosphate aminotransferase [isomerizing] n=1 Tax=Eiseniibacteriota bacterium TaxID=2212470 RepID=A0A538SJW5_UNCEI|nr:MAG: glutamine--fructose-6-phosphate transaminase (isomerizing) [Candidatus Eisenbacteria bacterium]
MCGIVGYVGHRNCLPILIEGIKRLEYRGYDSAGVAVQSDGALKVVKAAGKIRELEARLAREPLAGTAGIAHTRWATHGAPTDANAHPHSGNNGRVALVHNGIIENYPVLKSALVAEGHSFRTETDTEVLAHLVEKHLKRGLKLEQAVGAALDSVEGTYGIAVMCAEEPGTVVGARKGSPLVVGIADGEYFLASDVAPIVSHTRQVVYLDDGEMAVLTPEGFHTATIGQVPVDKAVQEVEWDLGKIEKGGFQHFMLKEIFDQPESVRDSMRGRVVVEEGLARLGGLNMTAEEMLCIKRIILLGCGTSWHAALIGEYMLEEHARIPVEVEYASEFRYRNPIVDEGTTVLVISQSGETADTLAAMREARRKGARALGIVNVVGSTIARESDGGVYIHAGPEIGVASTKAFTSQVTVLALLTLALGRQRAISREQGIEIARELEAIPGKLREILERSDAVKAIAEKHYQHDNFIYLGRGTNFPVALEGALKLKEISYIHAEGYPAAEMKHGPIALIDENMPVVFICPRDSAYEKVASNMSEVRARSGRIIAIATEGDQEIHSRADHVIEIPSTLPMFQPLLSVVPLQLLAYHVAVLRGCDVDQPRNLAKSVTVE